MNGAESLVKTLVRGGVDVCFANPGTSEMHFVSALDRIPGIRCVLGLFEGVVTGAADGYYRMAEKPAATLLHLGPGLGNGLANLHNARRANSSIVNIVGEHATYHIQYDAPLTSDIESIARPMSAWVHTSREARLVGADAADAIAVARSPKGQIATLILPADTAWNEGGVVGTVPPTPGPRPVPSEVVQEVVEALKQGDSMILIGNRALRADALPIAAAIGAATGVKVASLSRNPRIERGAGRVSVDRIPNPVENSRPMLAALKTLILVDEVSPVSFFAQPGKIGKLTADTCRVLTLAASGDDVVAALTEVAEAFGALIPENAIICDESITSGRGLFPATAGAPPHDWLQLTGGSIGMGIPLSTGAAVACPERQVINLQADGSGMYTFQALWTQAREKLNVVTVIWANRSYKILHGELINVGAGAAGPTARTMLDLDNPTIDWVSLAKGMGVEGARATTMEEFTAAMTSALARPGPFLIEVVL